MINHERRLIMIPALDIDPLKTFLAIADTGSFTRAAEEVNKTQSAVSMQMKRLEEQLARPLFAKDGRGVRFTHDGEKLIDYARRMVALSDETVSAFIAPAVTGKVRFGTPEDYADVFLPEILARFGRTHPHIDVDVECLNSEPLTQRVKSGEFDLAVVTFCGAEITGEALRREPFHWVTSARHSAHLAEVLPLASSHIGCSWRKRVIGALEAQERKYRIAYSSPNLSTINAAVLAGLAVGAMPAICVRPGMRVLTEKDGFPPLGNFEIGLIRKPGKVNAATEALARHIRDALNSPRFAMAAE
jgi:DNA-binding transcriptional LysR family regulator